MCKDELDAALVYRRTATGSASFVTAHNMLILTLYWLCQYPSLREMATEWDIPVSTLKGLLVHVLIILDSIIVPAFIQPLQSNDPSSPLSSHHDVYMIIDSTFIPVPRACTDTERRASFHFKSPTKFACKVQISCNINNMIIYVSDVV